MKKFFKKNIAITVVLFLLALAGIGTSIYYYWKYEQTVQLLNNPSAATQTEAAMIIDNANKLMDLPKDEQPTIATVTDITKLSNQPFFTKAQNGDKVLIYTKAKQAVLYRPSTNKIISVGPISIGVTTPSPIATVSATPAVIRVALYNGTTTTGLTKVVEQKLKDTMKQVSVVTKVNAAKQDYPTTLVIPLDASQKSSAVQLAQLLSGQVGSLPVGEKKPVNVDVLVIMGSNYR